MDFEEESDHEGDPRIRSGQVGVAVGDLRHGGLGAAELESTRDYKNPTAIQKVELQSMINPRLLVNAVGGYSGYVTDYDAARSFARTDASPRQDLAR